MILIIFIEQVIIIWNYASKVFPFNILFLRYTIFMYLWQMMETEGMSKAQELENLRLRLSAEEDRHNDSRKEVTRLKSRVGSINVDMDLFYGMNKLF